MTTETTEVKPAEQAPNLADNLYGKTDEKPEGSQAPPVEAKPVENAPAPVPEAKPEEAKPAPPVEGEIKLVAPEKYLLDQKRVDEIVAFAKEHKLSNDQAQKIMEKENDVVAGYVQKLSEEHDNEVKQWAKQIESDPVLGGDKFKETVAVSHEVVKRYGSDGLRNLLNDSGYGNHPEVVKLFYKIGKEMQQGKFISSSAASSTEKKLEDVFYGKTN